MPNTLLNTELVRTRRRELGLSLRTIANALGTTTPTVLAIEAGTNHPELTLNTVQRLAAVLATDIVTLLDTERREEIPHDLDGRGPNQGDDDRGSHPPARPDREDAATVGALLHAAEILTPVGALAEATSWDLARTTAALTELEGRLPTVGLRLHRRDDKVTIRRAVEPLTPKALEHTVRAHLARQNLNLTEARLLAKIIDNQAPREPTNPERVAIAVLVNARLVTDIDSPKPTSSERPLTATDDVLYSLMLSDDQP